MAELSLAVEPRAVLGKKVSALRRSGMTPANIYGHNVPSLAIQADTHTLGLLLRRAGRTGLIALAVSGEAEPRAVLVRAVQRKPTTGDLLHIDFLEVSLREKLRVNVPVTLTGSAPVADTTDSVIVQNLDRVEVECLPSDIPSQLEVDISGMAEPGAQLHVRDIQAPAGVVITTDGDILLVSTSAPVAEEEPETAESVDAADVPVVGDEEQTEEA